MNACFGAMRIPILRPCECRFYGNINADLGEVVNFYCEDIVERLPDNFHKEVFVFCRILVLL